MIAINAIAILLGLRPLRRVRDALAMVREGTAQRLDGRFPAEIEPLANETNALIENNRRIVERSRTQVGNLAHSLKTPLAVLLNEGRALGGAKGQLIAEQAAVHAEAGRALSAARPRRRAARQRRLSHAGDAAGAAHGAGDAEAQSADQPVAVAARRPRSSSPASARIWRRLLGNLLENAMKWAKSAVSVSRRAVGQQGAMDALFEIGIEDDGPGIPEDKAREALKRGRRLDETKPGTGLGLAIVADLVNEYGGTLALERSVHGRIEGDCSATRALQ